MPISRPSKPPEPVYASVVIAAFPAQVLSSWKPHLMGRPFAVIRQVRNGHATVAVECSAEAAALGAEPGTPVPILAKRFPHLLLVPRDERLEKLAREDLAGTLEGFTPDFRIREDGTALLDLTGTPLLREKTLPEACLHLKTRIKSSLGIRFLSIGASATPLAAQVLARSARPDGTAICTAGSEGRVLASLPAALLPGLSAAARDRLGKYALSTIGQLLALGRETLLQHFGREGERIYALASGLDVGGIPRAPATLEAETVLEKDVNDTDMLHRLLRLTVDRLVFRLRQEGCITDRFTLEIRYADNRSGRKTFACLQPTQDFGSLVPAAAEAFRALYVRRVAIRSLRLSARKPRRHSGQLDLFWSPEAARQDAIGRALDRIRSKHTFGSVVSGSSVELA